MTLVYQCLGTLLPAHRGELIRGARDMLFGHWFPPHNLCPVQLFYQRCLTDNSRPFHNIQVVISTATSPIESAERNGYICDKTFALLHDCHIYCLVNPTVFKILPLYVIGIES